MLRRIFSYMKEYKKYAWLALICIGVEVVLEIMVPKLMADLIDIGVTNSDVPYIINKGIQMAVCAVAALILGVGSARFSALAGQGLGANIRKAEYEKLQSYSFSNIDHFSVSSLVTRLTSDVTNIQNAVSTGMRPFGRSPVMLIFATTLAFQINSTLALVFLVALPVLAVLLIIIIINVGPRYGRMQGAVDLVNRCIEENLTAVRVVKSYVRGDYEIEKFHGVSKYVYQLFTTAEKIVAWNSPVMQFVMYAVIMILVYIGGKGIVTKTMETGALTSIIVYALQIIGSLMMVTFVFVMIMIAGASTDRITEVLDEIPEMIDPADAVTSVADGDIVFDHVSFSYAGEGGNLSLKDVNLHIKSGQTVGIIGGTGSAKSTLVQLIPRLYDVTKGSVMVSGVDVRKYNLEALRDQVSMVLQKNVLFSGTIYDNIRWGNENASDEEVQNVCKLAQADGFVREFPDGYNTQIVQGGNNVSGGQKQRLCIARALLKKPKILILDDSTSAVDTKTDALIRKAFREEIPNTTKIIIAQRVSSIEDADQIIVLENGAISGIGTSEELLKTNDIYREVYESQVKGGEDHE